MDKFGYNPGKFNSAYDPYTKGVSVPTRPEEPSSKVPKTQDIGAALSQKAADHKKKSKKKKKNDSDSEKDSSDDSDKSSSEEDSDEEDSKKKESGPGAKKKGTGMKPPQKAERSIEGNGS
jgi:hypothetical protein